jgi:arylsulfatase A-like enzyme
MDEEARHPLQNLGDDQLKTWIVGIVVILLLVGSPAFAKGKAEHVVVIVWDGMRPDFVNETNTPTLAKLARTGVFFANHHAVYISSTEVNGAALATGMYPNRNGVIANREYRPAIDPLRRIEIEAMETIVKGDKASGGHYLRTPTLPEILRRTGRTVAIAGTKPVAMLFDRSDPEHVKLSDAPKFDVPNTRVDAATTQILVGSLWEAGVPTFSLLWLSDPDATQHATWPGADKALQAMKSVDADLALVLGELEAKGARDKTDVFVVSDHGFSTVMRTVDVADTLRKAGFQAAREFQQPPRQGDVVVVGNGGSVLIYVIGRYKPLTRKIVEFLQQQDFTGVIMTRESMPGTFTLEQVRLNSPDAPDIVLSMRWTDETNQAGVPGMIVSDGATYGKMTVGNRRGGHSSLSPFDVHNTLIAAGPDFRSGLVDPFPSGNTDLAPTILHVLGVPPPQPMDGRVLAEAFAVAPAKLTPVEAHKLENSRDGGEFIWQQYLWLKEFGGATYLDGGNGSSQVIHSEEKAVSP